jgi:hypothetical protein
LSSSSVPLSVKVDVCLGWAVALFVVALVPLDVVVVRRHKQRAEWRAARTRSLPSGARAAPCRR